LGHSLTLSAVVALASFLVFQMSGKKDGICFKYVRPG
jgi:hypothetical protein